jgi:hypothetical protein|eukprot:COSAG02_NODE_685_length_18484_cov_49.605330_5_plen_161_part_00
MCSIPAAQTYLHDFHGASAWYRASGFLPGSSFSDFTRGLAHSWHIIQLDCRKPNEVSCVGNVTNIKGCAYFCPLPATHVRAINFRTAMQHAQSSKSGQTDRFSPFISQGVFNPACFIHTRFTNDIQIRGVNYKEGLLRFIAGETAKFQDDCGELCNPTCN